MAKTIYTERDVEDAARRGVKEIALTDDIYLTDVARERAEKLGIALRTSPTSMQPASAMLSVPKENVDQVVSQVKADVIAKLGPSVDPVLIERIVRRVLGKIEIED